MSSDIEEGFEGSKDEGSDLGNFISLSLSLFNQLASTPLQ
jgi:hypothetical protein